MTKSEILEVVKRMQKDWEESSEYEIWMQFNKCYRGFCYYLFCKNIDWVFIIKELEKDLITKITNKEYWYVTCENVGKQALIPRLNHLNRTIARLENELKNEQNGTL
jgi:hypothetical protein